MPTVAPKMPRETLVGFWGLPSQVFIQFATASTSTAVWLVEVDEGGVWLVNYFRILRGLFSFP